MYLKDIIREGESDMIYFDNAATTCVFPEVVEAMQDAMQVTYGNPSAKTYERY